MGRIFDAVRRHYVFFCDLNDPFALMRVLATHLLPCDLEEVKAGYNSHGTQYANERLITRLDGKVKLDEFIAALRLIGQNELADKIEGIEGSSASAGNSGYSSVQYQYPPSHYRRHLHHYQKQQHQSGISSASQTGSHSTTINNYFDNSQVNMQQGNCNNLEALSTTLMQQSVDSESQSSDSDFSYDVVTQSPVAPDREFDSHTLDAFGVVGRRASSDQVSDEETYEKQVFLTDDVTTSPKGVYEAGETSVLVHLQPSAASQFEFGDQSRCVDRAADAGSSSRNGTDVTLNSRGCMEGSEHCWQVPRLTDEDAAGEDTVRKDVEMHPAASGDGDNDDDGGREHGPVSDDYSQADHTAGLRASQELESLHHTDAPVQRIIEDAYSADYLLEHNFGSADEAAFTDNTTTSSASESIHQTSLVNDDVVSDQPASSNDASPAALEHHTSTYWSWLRSAFFQAAQVGLYVCRYASV